MRRSVPRYAAVEHPLVWDAAVSVEHPVGIGQLDLAAGEEVGDLVRGGACELSKIIVSGPRASLHQQQRRGDELLDITQILLGLLAPLIDLAVPAVQLGKQLIRRRVGLQCLDASLGDRPAADAWSSSRPSPRRHCGIRSAVSQRLLPLSADAQLLWRRAGLGAQLIGSTWRDCMGSAASRRTARVVRTMQRALHCSSASLPSAQASACRVAGPMARRRIEDRLVGLAGPRGLGHRVVDVQDQPLVRNSPKYCGFSSRA